MIHSSVSRGPESQRDRSQKPSFKQEFVLFPESGTVVNLDRLTNLSKRSPLPFIPRPDPDLWSTGSFCPQCTDADLRR
jgi:hypothetical protein